MYGRLLLSLSYIAIQCAHNTSPCCFVATQTFNGGAVKRWECFTNAISMKTFALVACLQITEMLVTRPAIHKKLYPSKLL